MTANRKQAIHIIIIAAVCYFAGASYRVSASPLADTMPGSTDEHIRTLRTTLNGDEYAPAAITLGSGDVLAFSFDHLSDDRHFFRYSLTHCNSDWQPSGLVESEYIDGFNEGTVDDYAFSRGTTVNYVHYSFTFPNGDMMPLVSGNYLLTLYEDRMPEQPLARWRFMVNENAARIGISATSRTDTDYNKAHQQLSIAVDTDRQDVEDPFNDLTVMIQQNGRLDNETALRHPLRMSGRKAVYEHQAPLLFTAGNEYRRFETVGLDFPGMGVEGIEYINPYYHVALSPDLPRGGGPYCYDRTQQGRYRIREYDSAQCDETADYTIVHFSLDMPERPGTMVFIDGDLTDRRFDESARMTYNHVSGRYEKALLLKQGSYNYQYLTVAPGERSGSTAPIEGDHYQTVNEYTVKVYSRRPGERYDRLIGLSRIVYDR